MLHTSLHFSAGQTQYWHRASGDNAYDRWECTLVSVDDRQRIGIEYINLDHWTTPAGTFSSPLRDPTLVPEDDKEDHSTPITLPGHEGQGWMIGRSPDPQARTVLAWQYPDGYYLIVSMRYEEGAPAPDNNAQALQDLAVAVIDRIPPIAAGPDQEFTIHPDDQST
ncbi:hypothetical protein NSA19_07340 [Actinomyces bowdenii]|uniref:hypothetical protein n=1 Tax=Actinomyces bowdenii TaxID=131109 RepID=UPI00214C3F24|nr:hypothetical protein [Actinomyces bowdenii]MCR2052664.1 hypothetical protein [Actinomyces bowdenii]